MAQLRYERGRLGANKNIPSDRTNAQESSLSADREFQTVLFASLRDQQPNAQRLMQQQTVQSEQKDPRDPRNHDRSVRQFEPSADAKSQEVSRSAAQPQWTLWCKRRSVNFYPVQEFSNAAEWDQWHSSPSELRDPYGSALMAVADGSALELAVFRTDVTSVDIETYNNGGRWIIKFSPQRSGPVVRVDDPRNETWIKGVEHLMRNDFKHYDNVLGLVLHIENGGYGECRLELWIEDAYDQRIRDAIGRSFREKCEEREMAEATSFEYFAVLLNQRMSEHHCNSESDSQHSQSDASMQHQRDDESKASDQNSPETAASRWHAWTIYETEPPNDAYDVSNSNFRMQSSYANSSFSTRDEFDENFDDLSCTIAYIITQGAGYFVDTNVGVFRNETDGVIYGWESYVDGGAAVVVKFQSRTRTAQVKDTQDNLWYGMLLAMIHGDFSFSDDIFGLVLHIGKEANPEVTIEVWLKKLKRGARSTRAEIQNLMQRYKQQIRNETIRYEPFSIRSKKQNLALHRVRENLTMQNQQHHSERETLRSDLAHTQSMLMTNQGFFRTSNAMLLQYAADTTKLQSQMNTMRSEMDKLKAAKFMNDKHNTTRDAKISRLEKEKQTMAITLEKRRREAAWHKKENVRLSHDYDVQLKDLLAHGQSHIRRLSEKNKELQAKVDARERDTRIANAKVDKLLSRCERRNDENKKLKSENEELRSKIAELKKKMSEQ